MPKRVNFTVTTVSGQNEEDEQIEEDGCPADLNGWFVKSINEFQNKLKQGVYFGESKEAAERGVS